MKNFLERLGVPAKSLIDVTGEMTLMFSRALLYAITPPFKLRNLFKQMEFIGVNSLFVVILTGSFTGMVLAMQSYEALKEYGAESMVGSMVALSMTRELGPVLTGLMVAGRAGSAIATEIGTMKVTEQIDALYTMAVNPIKYLVTPRLLAGFLMLPLLTIISDFVGVVGGYVIGVKMLNINPGVYIGRTVEFVDGYDIMYGLIKSFVFGGLITLVSCYSGYITKGGAEGVGKAATNAVVTSCVLILLFDYILTSIMFGS